MQLRNFTPVPDELFDVHLKDLSLGELKILLIIIRKTLGFRQSKYDKRFKVSDWISVSQFKNYAGCSNRTIASAITSLVRRDLIEVFDQKGTRLVNSGDRSKRQRLYFRQKFFQVYREPDEHLSRIPEKNSLEFQQKVHATIYTPTIDKQTNRFIWKDYLSQLHDSSFRPHNIIAYFFEKKGLKFSSRRQVQLAIDRHISSAKKVQHFPDIDIARIVSHLKNTFPQFTLETVYKHLTN